MSPLKIIEIVLDYYKISIDEMTARVRKGESIKPVHIAMYFLESYTTLSLLAIAKLFNRQNHSTTINAIKSVNNQIDTDKNYRLEIAEIDFKIKNYDNLKMNTEIFMENDFYKN